MNVIKQIVNSNSQTIKMIVKANERGPQGQQGEAGTAATIAAGEAYSVDAGAQPVVMNVGTSTEARFDFYIPKGERGERGENGEDGKDGAIQYVAGAGIAISPDNVISATGGTSAEWGLIGGNIADQTDLQQEFAKYTPSESLAAVATTGAYSDLSGTPTIPAAQVNSDWNATTGAAEILNKPTIPTVNNATLTITSNGTSAGTFTANASTDVTIALTSPTITMTDTDPGEGSSLAEGEFIAVYGEDPIILDYSTSEINTGTKWINGKTIYKKTVQILSLPNATSTGYPHGVSNLETVVDIKGIHRAGAYAYDLSAPGIGGAQYGLQLSVDATNIYVNVGTDRHSDSADITIYYTKTS